MVTLHNKYEGLEIFAFPCNQFGGQEPQPEKDIKKFAKSLQAKFIMFSKVEVNGAKADPVFKFLRR